LGALGFINKEGKEKNMDGTVDVKALPPTSRQENAISALEAIDDLNGVLPHLGLEADELNRFRKSLAEMVVAVLKRKT